MLGRDNNPSVTAGRITERKTTITTSKSRGCDRAPSGIVIEGGGANAKARRRSRRRRRSVRGSGVFGTEELMCCDTTAGVTDCRQPNKKEFKCACKRV